MAVFGASGMFGQLQHALNTAWGVKVKPGGGFWRFLRTRFLSFSMVAGICFLLLVSLVLESVLQAVSRSLEGTLPGGTALAVGIYFAVDLAAVILLFAVIFKYLPDARVRWRDVWVGAALTGILFVVGKWALGLYLGSGAAGSACGAASSLITLLLWIYYSSQILIFGAEFTQVYADEFGTSVIPKDYAERVA